MPGFEISSVDGVATIAVSGSMTMVGDASVMAGLLAEVGDDDHLIIDVTSTDRLSADAARAMREVLIDRLDTAEVVIASTLPEVTLQLVLNDIDRLVPIVPSARHALDVIRARSGIAGAA